MRSARRGATAVTVALAMGVVLALAALVVDLGMARVAQGQLQAATDAAALAGARVLDGTTAGLDAARTAGEEIAGANGALGEPVTLEAGAVEVGRWDEATHALVAEADETKVNAVQVTARRDDLRSWFAAAIGHEHLSTSASSIAVRGGGLGAGEVPYYLPFSLPDCVIEAHTGEQLADITFVLSPAGADTVGWGAVETNPSASWAKTHIEEMLACIHEFSESGNVSTACAEVEAGDTVNLGNGAESASLQALSDAMSEGVPWVTDRWGTLPPQHKTSSVPTRDYGTILEGPIPVFVGSSVYCSSAAPWNETYPIRGFVWGVIYDVAAKGKAAQKNVWVRLDVSHIYPIGSGSGGDDWGITYPGPPLLVR